MRQIVFYNNIGVSAASNGWLLSLRRQGWGVDCCRSSDEAAYRNAQTPMERLALRFRMYAWYGLRAAWQAATPVRQSLQVVSTNPFFGPNIVMALSSSGITINLLYDLYPDALILAKVLKAESAAARALGTLTQAALKKADATVFLGNTLRGYVESVYGPARYGVVIPVGAPSALFKGRAPKRREVEEILTVLYAGQMGRMHDTDTVRDALRGHDFGPVRFRFQGHGERYRHLKNQLANNGGCEWGEGLGSEEWREVMLSSPVALVTVAAGAERVVMPSKVYSAMVAGQAVLAICRRHSDLAKLVTAHDCGWVVEPGDVEGFRRCLHTAVSDAAALQQKRQNAFDAGHRYYGDDVIAESWKRLFEMLIERKRQRARSIF